jgi:hypothetical protein
MTKLTLWENISVWWCQTFHHKAMWPVHGVYECRSCFKKYAFPETPLEEIPAGVYINTQSQTGTKVTKSYVSA